MLSWYPIILTLESIWIESIFISDLSIITLQPNQNIITCFQQINQQNNSIRFQRFILFWIISERYEYSYLVHIIVHYDANSSIFHHNLVLRENEVIYNRYILFLLSQLQIDENMQEIPLLCTDSPAVSLSLPLHLQTVTPTQIFKVVVHW